jgi:hypothetical protein
MNIKKKRKRIDLFSPYRVPKSPPKPKIIAKDIEIYATNSDIFSTTNSIQTYFIKHKFFTFNKEFSVFLSGSTFINLDQLLDSNFREYDISVFRCRKFQCIYDDFAIAKKIYWHISEAMESQINDYKSQGYPYHHGVLECDVIIRKNCNLVKDMDKIWREECQKYEGNPDIYGFNYAVFKTNPKVLILPDKYRKLSR